MWQDPTPLTRKEYFHYFSACALTMVVLFIGLVLLKRLDVHATIEQVTRYVLIMAIIFMYGAYNNYGAKRKKEE